MSIDTTKTYLAMLNADGSIKCFTPYTPPTIPTIPPAPTIPTYTLVQEGTKIVLKKDGAAVSTIDVCAVTSGCAPTPTPTTGGELL